MTLTQIQQALTKVNLKEKFFDHTYGESRVNRLNNFRQTINLLSKLPIFPAEIAKLKESALFHSTGDSLVHESGENYHLLNTAEYVRTGAIALLNVINQLISKEDETTIAIKLPTTSDIEEIIKYLGEINTAISQNIINGEINGKVELKDWQPGSLWLYIGLGSIAAVKIVMGIVWASAVIRKKQQEARIIEKLADGLEIKNQTLDELRKGAQEQIKLLIEAEAKNLAAHNFEKDDNREQIERLKLGIKTFTDLIEKGMEVHPALKTPENVKNLFPDFNKLDSIESQTKLLSESNQSKAK
jgi:hypothetical protein